MFTGIIESIGTVRQRGKETLRIDPGSPLKGLALGESVSVDGVCLTLDRREGSSLWFRLLPETRRVSTLGGLRPGSRVNLERSLRVGSRLGGHLLLGHVDGRGTVLRNVRRGSSVLLEIGIPEEISPFLVPKGPVAVDGVSLTLDFPVPGTRRVPGTDVRFWVHLVSHTLKATTLGKKGPGVRVNLETDLVAKYLLGVL